MSKFLAVIAFALFALSPSAEAVEKASIQAWVREHGLKSCSDVSGSCFSSARREGLNTDRALRRCLPGYRRCLPAGCWHTEKAGSVCGLKRW
jgi:hypothetical protein